MKALTIDGLLYENELKRDELELCERDSLRCLLKLNILENEILIMALRGQNTDKAITEMNIDTRYLLGNSHSTKVDALIQNEIENYNLKKINIKP